MIERKVELLSFVSACLIIAALLKLFVFYKLFDLNILPFIQLSEVVISCFDSLMVFALISGYIAFVIQIHYRPLLGATSSILGLRIMDRLKCYKLISMSKVILLLTTIIAASAFNFLGRANPSGIDLSLWVAMAFLSVYAVPVLLCEVDRGLRKRKMPASALTLGVVFSSALLLCTTVSLAYNEARKIGHDGYYNGCFVMVKGANGTARRVDSTQEYSYIGQTAGYVFFHDYVSGRTDIVPKETVLFMSLK